MVRQGGQGEVGFGWSRLGMARQGGQGVLCSGMASYGEIWSGEAVMVTVSHGV